MEINDLIVKHAKQFIGLKEKPGNAGWHDKLFQQRMANLAGWKVGEAYCSYFTELVWRDVYRALDMDIDRDLENLFSPSATKTWENFQNSPRWMTSKDPIKGALVYFRWWKNGKPKWQGHGGIVEEPINSLHVTNVEANYNDMIAQVERKKNFYETEGLVMLGFVWPKQVMTKIKTLEDLGL